MHDAVNTFLARQDQQGAIDPDAVKVHLYYVAAACYWLRVIAISHVVLASAIIGYLLFKG